MCSRYMCYAATDPLKDYAPGVDGASGPLHGIKVEPLGNF